VCCGARHHSAVDCVSRIPLQFRTRVTQGKLGLYATGEETNHVENENFHDHDQDFHDYDALLFFFLYLSQATFPGGPAHVGGVEYQN